MTITVRIQYKGEGARKLAAEEHTTDRDATFRYVEDMHRALSMFQIPVPPDNSKAIWKSGFVLCNYNTTRDTPMFDRIYRGAFRAQSVACKTTLEGLYISYIHLFENSKPIFFGKQAQQRSLSPTARTQTLRQKSPSSLHRNKTWTRPLGPERSAPELSDRAKASEPIHRAYSDERKVYIKQEPSEPGLHASGTPENGHPMQEALKRLAGSQSLLALLGQAQSPSTSSSSDPFVKQELASPKAPPRAPRSLLASASSAESVNDLSGRRPLSPSMNSLYQRDDHFSRHTPQDDRLRSGYHHSYSGNRAYSPSPKGRSTSPPYRGRTLQRDLNIRTVGHDEDPRHSLNGSSHDHHHHTNKSWNNRYNMDPSPRYQHISYSSDKQDSTSGWSKGSKRPHSPTQAPGRSQSPPHHKRRYSIKGAETPSHSSPMEVDAVPRLSSSAVTTILSQPLKRSSISIASATTAHAAPVSNGTHTEDRNKTVQSLNRELWDLRRQTTALKAREESILTELKTLRAPMSELPNGAASPTKTSISEDKLKILEAEIISLRQRLQSETVRRQLVEEACENERRRRKHAEDLLDDARREGGAPLVVPAMMDAFERIAQLTGEALKSATD